MSNLYLEFPTLEREIEAKEYIKEFYDFDSEIHGTGSLCSTNDYTMWINKVKSSHRGISSEGKVPSSTYFAIREEDNKIVGMVNIRHILNEFLKVNGFGHIGYSVRPTERRKGYATHILHLALKKCSELEIETVHIGCYKDNIGSKRTIEKNGGDLYREFSDDEGKENLEYTILLK